VSSFFMHDMKKDDTIPRRARDRGTVRGGDARTDILHRIRGALRGAAPGDVPRNYRTEDTRGRDEIVNLFAERVAEYRATVHRVSESEVAETVRQIAEEAGARRIGIPEDLPEAWRPRGQDLPAGGEDPTCSALELVEDTPLSVQQLDDLDGALTGCAAAIAEVGGFVLDGGEGQGRRALTLVPDLHICVVREDQVVGLVPEAVRALEGSVEAGRPLTFVAGPSATSDIELDRVEGVHGPRVLHVVVAAS
jgi:L-lactate dehydrogenase complex protein LldG